MTEADAKPSPLKLVVACVKGYGSTYTLIRHKQKRYQVITEAEIRKMLAEPEEVEKSEATWMIPSSYREYDARNYEAQRLHGAYHWLTVDLDEGEPSLEALRDAIIKVIGPVTMYLYTSRSATADHEKCRALIPLAREVKGGVEWGFLQTALFDLLTGADARVTPDYALSRSAIPVYLPNRGAHYRSLIVEGDTESGPKLDVWGPAGEAIRKRAEKLQEDLRRSEAEAEARRAIRKAKEAERAAEDGPDLMQHFNAHFDLQELMLHYGYTEGGRDRDGNPLFTSPFSESLSVAVKVYAWQEPQRWTSRHQSDAKRGLGRRSPDGGTNGDAWDLFVGIQHDGNIDSAKEDYLSILEEAVSSASGGAGWKPDYIRVTAKEFRPRVPTYVKPDVEDLAGRIMALIKRDPSFNHRWFGHNDDLRNKSPSALDHRIALKMAKEGFTFSEIVYTLCRLFKHGSSYVGLEGAVPARKANWAKMCAFRNHAKPDEVAEVGAYGGVGATTPRSE